MRTEYCHEEIPRGNVSGGARPNRRWSRRLAIRSPRRDQVPQEETWDHLLRWLAVLDDLVEFRSEELRQLIRLRARLGTQFGDLEQGDPASTGNVDRPGAITRSKA